ncbi:MAG: PQQ-binding-like beta-propeller repeat protein [Acidobacteriaceae bacterium]
MPPSICSCAVVSGLAILGAAFAGQRPLSAAEAKSHVTWRDYEGGVDSAQYSALKQINKSNVSQLQQAWFYSAAGAHRFECSPIIVDNVMYVFGKDDNVVALDAATGHEIWVHDNGKPATISERGFTYWESEDRGDRRLFFATNNILHAVDARTGKLIDSFADHGNIDLREGLGRDPKTISEISSGTPGRIFENLLILGSTTGEEYGSPPGDLRAFDVRTGKLVWTFHTVPHPGDLGYDTWPKDAWKYIGGTNTWGGITIDEKRGIAYFPIGSPTYDFYGADRVGSDLFSDCLLALDARTGKYLWHFQIVHHDLWDYDLTTSPKLVTVVRDGRTIDAIAQAGKTGFLYVFDRVTGKPLWPIEERPVPKSYMPAEHAWPTQPFPTAPPPFSVQNYTADDVNPYIEDPAERAKLRDLLQHARNEGMFTPPGLENTLQAAGNNGGANWGNAAVDPTTNVVYVQSKNAPAMLKLAAKRPKVTIKGSPATKGQVLYIQNCQTCHTSELTGQPPAVPSLVDIVSRVGPERIRSLVMNGASPMPSFPDLSSDEIDSLIAYLKAPGDARVPPDVVAYLSAPPLPPPPAATDGSDAVRYWSGYGFVTSSDGLSAVKPPWSTLTAYDLNHGTIKWQVPLGAVAQLDAKGIRGTGSFFPQGGPAVTAGGLIFSGTESDFKMRAYDKDTGQVLWEHQLPAAPHAEIAVYEVDGWEYVVQAAITKPLGLSSEPAADNAQQTQGYYVFALPKAESARPQ